MKSVIVPVFALLLLVGSTLSAQAAANVAAEQDNAAGTLIPDQGRCLLIHLGPRKTDHEQLSNLRIQLGKF